MNLLSFEGVRVAGISVCVPDQIIENSQSGAAIFDVEELKKTIESIGVDKRRIANSGVCTSDLCFEAASTLLDSLAVNRDEIGAVIFITQTPDYHLPATACILQDKLGLPKQTIAFDINLGCSGFVYGLSVVFNLLNQRTITKALLLVGDTPSKCVSPFDRSSNLLFGDAGTATLVETNSDASPVYCTLSTDGSGYKSLIIEGGAYRLQSSSSTLEVREADTRNRRSLENIYMDGPDIFNFTIREIPKDILGLLNATNTDLKEIDLFFFHQANKFMIDFLAKKLKIPVEKYPLSLKDYGNTSSASIPLTIASARDSFMNGKIKAVLCGFGVGFSWGTMLMDFNGCQILPIKTL